jgi:phosphatidylserine decarboxylase
VRETDSFWLKSQAYSLRDMLKDNPLTKRFVGGTVYQTFVNGGADWHRFSAPITGTISHVELVEGYAWTESDTIPYDPMSGPYSQGWAAGVATRGLLFIDSGLEKLGTVCVVPIGLTEVSSLEFYKLENGTRRPLRKHDTVKKGEQIGWFSFGGSSFALVFQPGALREILVEPPVTGRNDQPDRTLWANKRFAIANV